MQNNLKFAATNMNEWKEYRLGELIDDKLAELQTGPFGTMLNASEYVSNGIPVIAVQDIGDNKLIHNKFVYIDNLVAERLKRYRVLENDIIFGRKGAVERRALIKKSEEGWLQGSDCIRLRLDSSIDSKFVSYQLSSNSSKEWMMQHATGATMPSLNQQILRLLPLRIPSETIQKLISSILSSLDDKIDLLHRQNKTLEAMAETLFRQWFVEEAEESWESGRLGDLVDFIYGRTLKDDVRSGFGYPVVGSSGIVGYHDTYLVEGPGLVTGRKGTLGRINYMHENFTPIDTTFYIVSKSDSKKLYFEYFLLKSLHLEEFNTDSAVPGLNRTIALSAEVILPSQTKIAKFNDTIDPLFLKIKRNLDQIKSLSKVRETMLPKLMSGELTVH